MITTPRKDITIEAYSSGTTRIADPQDEMFWAEGLTFANAYPGGDMDAAFSIKRSIVAWWALKGAQRVIFRQGDRIVYEGYVSSLDRLLDEQGEAVRVPLVGGWSHILMNRRWNKPWADKRISEDVWKLDTAATGAEKFTLDRSNRIMFVPKSEAMLNADRCKVKYTAPTGQTVKRVTYDYTLAEGAQAWELGLADSAFGPLVQITASATGATDHTLAAPDQTVQLYFISRAAQTPLADGTYYAKFSNIVVYTETGDIDATQIAIDIIGKFTELNSSTAYVNAITSDDILPFIAEWDSAADIVTRACSFGDSSNNRWAAYLLNSENAATPDGKPLLGIQQYPALTDYDLALRLNETDIAGAVEINQDFEDIWNWVVVRYADENGWTHWVTPDDDATLTDATSVANYGQRDYLMNLGYSTLTVATANGKRFLAAYKDPQWNASPIPVWDEIRRKGGDTIPPARIRAGQRLKVENFTTDLSGTGLTLLVTGVRYDDKSGIATLTFGQPLSPLMTILTPPPRIVEEMAASGDGSDGDGSTAGSGGGADRLNFYKTNIWKKALRMGLATKGDFKRLTAKQKRALKRAVRKRLG